MNLSEEQGKVVRYLIQEGATRKGRWVDVFTANLSAGSLSSLVKNGAVEEKTLPIPKRQWRKNNRGVLIRARFFYRVNAARLKPISGVRPGISREILRALLKAKTWTDWRPFRYPGEWMGAARCGVLPRKRSCLKVATHVSYTVPWPGLGDLDGRIAMCEKCLPDDRVVVNPFQ